MATATCAEKLKLVQITLAELKYGMPLRLQDLYTFFVVARAGAMHLAASELNVTPGAISQRIRATEERTGKRLFHRSKGGLELTKTGEALWRDLNAPFTEIEAANLRHTANQSDALVRISTSTSFASAVLVPKLGDFTRDHPHIRVSIETDRRLVDLRSEPIDLAIRHGLGDYVGLKSERINAPELIVLASPKLLAKGSPINAPQDCLAYTLLQDSTSTDWPLWFEAHGVNAAGARYGPNFRDDFLVVRATVEGQGLGLISDTYVTDELQKGQLVKALDTKQPTRFAYYAVALPTTFERPAIRTFVSWLKIIGDAGGRAAP